jgi:hypothetical protein
VKLRYVVVSGTVFGVNQTQSKAGLACDFGNRPIGGRQPQTTLLTALKRGLQIVYRACRHHSL